MKAGLEHHFFVFLFFGEGVGGKFFFSVFLVRLDFLSYSLLRFCILFFFFGRMFGFREKLGNVGKKKKNMLKIQILLLSISFYYRKEEEKKW